MDGHTDIASYPPRVLSIGINEVNLHVAIPSPDICNRLAIRGDGGVIAIVTVRVEMLLVFPINVYRIELVYFIP